MDYSPWIKFQKNSHRHGRSKGTHHEKSTRKIIGQEKAVPVWLLRALTYHLKGMPYRDLLPKQNSSEMGLYQQEAKKEADDAFTEAQKNCFMPEESLMKDESDEE